MILGGLFIAYREDLIIWYLLREDFDLLHLRNDFGHREYRHRASGIVMVYLPGGSFEMGSLPEEAPSVVYDDERPRHDVNLDAFLIAKLEVDQATWMALGDRSNPSARRGDDLPVDSVTWLECLEFCERLGLSLPTEAQWEYACRGGVDEAFTFGATLSSDQANYDARYNRDPPPGEFRGKTVAVGTLEPNRYGLHDTHGNVWEWCRDRYEVNFYSRLEASGRNPYAPTTGIAARSELRVMRGGGWKNYAEGCRSALRDYCTETEGRDDLGFRPVYNLER